METAVSGRRYRAGDRVRIRSAAEILTTLDPVGSHQGIPFMPEMLERVGGEATIAKRVVKFCWHTPESSSRAIEGSYFLRDDACDGAAHGGCQAGCRPFWKEAWLDAPGSTAPPADPGALEQLRRLVEGNTTRAAEDGTTLFRCHQTEAVAASNPIGELEIGQYVEELTSRNVRPRTFARIMLTMAWTLVLRKLGRYRSLPFEPAGERRVDGEALGLAPGDLVEVRSLEEIAATLDANGKHRGLLFPTEAIQHVGRRFRVRGKVERLVDEHSGRLLRMKNDCVLLEDVICYGERTPGVWFCPREFPVYWREAWLERVDEPPAPG